MRFTSPWRAATALALLAAPACTKKADPRARPPVPVTVTRVRKADIPYTIEANGVVIPFRTASVGSQVEGIIKRVAFAEGSDVVAGQTLFEIDQRPYRAAYAQAAANLERDRANAENARKESQRYAGLAQQDYVTKEQADQQRANAAASSATVGATEAQVQTAKFNLDNTIIRAPISGRSGSVLVKEGNLVHASGATPLVVINQVSPILVRFAIPSTQLPLLQKYGNSGILEVVATPNSGTAQMTDSATSPIGLNIGGGDPSTGATLGGPPGGTSGGRGTGGAGAGGGGRSGGNPSSPSSQLVALVQPEHGTLSFIDNAVDTTTGTVLLKASFPNPNKRLWAGEFVSTQLKLFIEQNALVVPSSAVVTGQSGAYVYVISDSSTAQQRPVVVERVSGNQSIIASGLRAGEQVVTEGQSRLTPNAKVTTAAPGAGAGPGGGRGGRGGKGGRAGGGGAPAGQTPAAATPAADGAAPAAAGNQGRAGRAGRGTPTP